MAPRACPAWIGPVGLDETNSTFTRRPAPNARRPKSATPLSTTSRSTSCNHVCARWKLTNPGPAISTLSTCAGGSLFRRSAIDWANSRGLRPAFFAEANATLLDQSPCSRRAARSRLMTSGSGWTSSATKASRSAATSWSRSTVAAYRAALHGLVGLLRTITARGPSREGGDDPGGQELQALLGQLGWAAAKEGVDDHVVGVIDERDRLVGGD